jgi:hypothetical protein
MYCCVCCSTLVLSPATLHSVSSVMSCCQVTWHCNGARRVIHSAGDVLYLHYSCLSACLAGIDYAAYPHVLHALNGPDVRRLGNVHACIGNMCA